MTKVDERSTAVRSAGSARAAARRTTPGTGRPVPFPVQFWRSAVAKKWVMAVTGVMLMGFVLAHLIGNLKIYLGRSDINEYAEWLRDLGHPALPRTVLLWALRVGLAGAFFLHILAAYQLTVMNRRARPVGYQAPRDYVAANFASRTMRWTGVIVGFYVIFHLLDMTWGKTGATWVRGDPYENMIHSFQRVPVAIAYMVANLALGIHLFHGAWSMFQSLGINNPRFNRWRRTFAYAFAGIITLGNLSFPFLIVTKVYP